MQERFAQTHVGGWFAVNVANPIDRRLLKVGRGKLGLFLGQPVGLLGTTGARSGQPRETPLLYVDDGARVIVVASNVGKPHHPAWFHNLRAHPEVTFLRRGGHQGSYLARVAEGSERAELWKRVNDLYAGYETYQHRTDGREIPVVVLDPVPAEIDA